LFVLLPDRCIAATEYPDGYQHPNIPGIKETYAEAMNEADVKAGSSPTYGEIPYQYRCEFSCPDNQSETCEKIYTRVDSYLWQDENIYFEALENSTDLRLTHKYCPHENHYELPEKIAVIVVHFEKSTDEFSESCAGPACPWINEQKSGKCLTTSIVFPLD
jgi:hypothetical protein